MSQDHEDINAFYTRWSHDLVYNGGYTVLVGKNRITVWYHEHLVGVAPFSYVGMQSLSEKCVQFKSQNN